MILIVCSFDEEDDDENDEYDEDDEDDDRVFQHTPRQNINEFYLQVHSALHRNGVCCLCCLFK